MRYFLRLAGAFAVFSLLVSAIPALGMDKRQAKEFQEILNISFDDLTELARNTLLKKYPGENWESYRFPLFVFTNDSVEAAYKIAVKQPELLAKIPCYCACKEAGHKNLLHCYLTKGVPGAFDKHASFCTICYRQAMMALLWADQGATDHEINEGMKKRFMRERPIPEGITSP